MIIKFNSGRGYTDQGQRIAATVLEFDDYHIMPMSKVLFVDIDRGLHGILTIYGTVNQRSIMNEYDESRFEYRSVDRGLIAELEAAAATL